MKKLIAASCCVFFLQSFPHFVFANDPTDRTESGKRTLIKAIAAIINAETARKTPPKRVYLPNLESPQE